MKSKHCGLFSVLPVDLTSSNAPVHAPISALRLRESTRRKAWLSVQHRVSCREVIGILFLLNGGHYKEKRGQSPLNFNTSVPIRAENAGLVCILIIPALRKWRHDQEVVQGQRQLHSLRSAWATRLCVCVYVYIHTHTLALSLSCAALSFTSSLNSNHCLQPPSRS